MAHTPWLQVENGYTVSIPGLGKVRPFSSLSPQRVYRAVREALRGHYGESHVEVACIAFQKSGTWYGKCAINGQAYTWNVSTI